MKLSLAISPCPNDTFMFDALLHGKIDTLGYEFDLTFLDIDYLNKGVVENSGVDISKISYATYPQISESYKIARSGSAIGYGNAPLVVSKHKIYPDELPHCSVAIPGEGTTAALLLNFAFGAIPNSKVYLFSDIAEAVESGEVDAGVLIHEERFTYGEKGLKLVADLGQIWESKMHLPIPLGAIALSRRLDEKVAQDFNTILHNSIRFAFENPSSSRSFVKSHAQKTQDSVIDSHIEMFVNNFSLDLGEKGIDAVIELLNQGGGEFSKEIFV